MSEEEKEAIKLLKQEPDFSLSYYKREHAIDIVLNLIEKQQKEIEDLKEVEQQICNEELITQDYVTKNYISKNKIRELIKNDKENIETLNNSYNFESAYVQTELEEKRRRKEILEELLGEY